MCDLGGCQMVLARPTLVNLSKEDYSAVAFRIRAFSCICTSSRTHHRQPCKFITSTKTTPIFSLRPAVVSYTCHVDFLLQYLLSDSVGLRIIPLTRDRWAHHCHLCSKRAPSYDSACTGQSPVPSQRNGEASSPPALALRSTVCSRS